MPLHSNSGFATMMLAAFAGPAGLAWAQAPAAIPIPGPRQPPPLPHRRGHSPCAEPPGVFLRAAAPPPPLHTERIPPPARAVAEHVTGCAGIRFHIGADGRARDVTMVMEFPGQYGFGDIGRQVIAGSQWAPQHGDSWYYINLRINPPTPAGRP